MGKNYSMYSEFEQKKNQKFGKITRTKEIILITTFGFNDEKITIDIDKKQ